MKDGVGPRKRLHRIGFVVHGGRPEARSAAEDAAARLRDEGVGVVACAGDSWADPSVEVRDPRTFADGLDLTLVFGGDGTFLRAAYLVRDEGVPLLGINLGRLGFLSEVELADLPGALKRLVDGDFAVEERMTLAVDVRDANGTVVGASWALNEASVERTVPQRLIVLELLVGDTTLAHLPCDAVICATPTGSTAYAFSAHGPVLSPLVEAIVLVPVAPHSLFDRTIVVDPRESVRIRPGHGQSCVVSLDGRETLSVPPEGVVEVSRGHAPVRMARLQRFDFYGRVREKFGLR